MTVELPDNVGRYFAAQNRQDADGMAASFAEDAEVLDEGRTYIGRDAIRDWKLETIAKYGVSVEPLTSSETGEELAVVARVTGNFPGSPANLTYNFKLDPAGLIRGLRIG